MQHAFFNKFSFRKVSQPLRLCCKFCHETKKLHLQFAGTANCHFRSADANSNCVLQFADCRYCKVQHAIWNCSKLLRMKLRHLQIEMTQKSCILLKLKWREKVASEIACKFAKTTLFEELQISNKEKYAQLLMKKWKNTLMKKWNLVLFQRASKHHWVSCLKSCWVDKKKQKNVYDNSYDYMEEKI